MSWNLELRTGVKVDRIIFDQALSADGKLEYLVGREGCNGREKIETSEEDASG